MITFEFSAQDASARHAWLRASLVRWPLLAAVVAAICFLAAAPAQATDAPRTRIAAVARDGAGETAARAAATSAPDGDGGLVTKLEGGRAPKACAHPPLPMPLTYSIEPRLTAAQQAAYRSGFAEVQRESNGHVGFVEREYGAEVDVYVLSSAKWADGATHVRMPCGRTDSVIYVGDDANHEYWAAHEVMHTLGFADHIDQHMSAAGYTHPIACPSSYVGVMSYCSSRHEWWGDSDDTLFAWWF